MIKNIFYFGLLSCVVVGLAGCAVATPQYFNKATNSWKGISVNQLTKKWGYPSATLSLADGKTYAYYWETCNDYYDSYSGIDSKICFVCNTYFTFDNNKKITHVHSEGNGCNLTQERYQALSYQPFSKSGSS